MPASLAAEVVRVVLLRLADDLRAERKLAVAAKQQGWDMASVDRPPDAEHRVRNREADLLVIHDSQESLEFGTRMRRNHAELRLGAIVPAHGSDRAAVLLSAGVDEVVSLAMAPAEIAVRLERVVRQAMTPSTASELSFGALVVDPAEGTVILGTSEIPLSRRERHIVEVLVRAGGRTVSRESLYRQVWGYSMARGDRIVDVNVKRIRGKLSPVSGEIQIVTRPGVGYRLHAGDSAAHPSRATDTEEAGI